MFQNKLSMKTKTYLFLIVVLGSAIIITFSCNKEELKQEPINSPPSIQNITCTPNTSSSSRLPGGEKAIISVTATDQDKDELSYAWEAGGGNFVGQTNQASVTWQSPISISLEDIQVTATVSDGTATISKSIQIYVDKVEPGINAIPKNFDFGSEIEEMQVKVFHVGQGQLKWETDGQAYWLTVDPSSGTLNTPNDTAYVSLIVDRNGIAPENYHDGFTFRNGENISDIVEIDVSMTVEETASLQGFVYYASTTIPISGVTVTINENNSTTGSDGYYEISDVITGDQTLTATKEGYDIYSTDIEIESGNNEYNIEMTSALYTHNLYGIITDEFTGEPISFVQVAVLNPDGINSELQTQSSSTGYYQIPTVPQGERTITFNHEDYAESEINITMSNSNYELDLEMEYCPPVVNTGSYEIIDIFRVDFIGEILSIGCDEVTEYGHCWSTSSIPTIDDNKTNLGNTNDIGEFTSELNYLIANENYYVRAYAINTSGTYYGEQINFTTPNWTDCGIISYEGEQYETVVIGNQCWMKRNLNYGGDYSYCYDNSSSNCHEYGRLYLWFGATQACPDGWQLPSENEWSILIDYLGGGSLAGGKLKESGFLHWEEPNVGANNESGFTALPGGVLWWVTSPLYEELNECAYFWSRSFIPHNGGMAWSVKLSYNSSSVSAAYRYPVNAFSARCIKIQ